MALGRIFGTLFKSNLTSTRTRFFRPDHHLQSDVRAFLSVIPLAQQQSPDASNSENKENATASLFKF